MKLGISGQRASSPHVSLARAVAAARIFSFRLGRPTLGGYLGLVYSVATKAAYWASLAGGILM
ncbi:MAG: hypothetical protein AMJ76_02785 [Dehalococcoidia bacterium SM23_28_1]|nr:MAG: hypothetical protein AMJ76_02785 [Dehalococcoidia bacterium SM23_28_1]